MKGEKMNPILVQTLFVLVAVLAGVLVLGTFEILSYFFGTDTAVGIFLVVFWLIMPSLVVVQWARSKKIRKKE